MVLFQSAYILWSVINFEHFRAKIEKQKLTTFLQFSSFTSFDILFIILKLNILVSCQLISWSVDTLVFLTPTLIA